jgi:hypothetical protein
MIIILIRLAKRFAVFLPGIAIAYVSFRYTLPFFDKRLPDIVGILVTYALAAYVLIPGLIRIYRIILPPKHLPLYCVTPDGFASDPLNIGLIGTRRQVIEAMEKAGWHMADPYTVRNIVNHVFCLVFSREYLNAPVSNLYLFGRKQDLAFEVSVDGKNTQRHHVRFWATTFEGKEPLARSIHWHRRKTHVQGDELLWVGAASLDIGIMPIRHNLQITHMVHPDTNQERELICNQLRNEDLIKKTTVVRLDNPYRLINRAWLSELHADGKMSVVYLKI